MLQLNDYERMAEQIRPVAAQFPDEAEVRSLAELCLVPEPAAARTVWQAEDVAVQARLWHAWAEQVQLLGEAEQTELQRSLQLAHDLELEDISAVRAMPTEKMLGLVMDRGLRRGQKLWVFSGRIAILKAFDPTEAPTSEEPSRPKGRRYQTIDLHTDYL